MSLGVEEVAVPAIRNYDPQHACAWDDLVARASNGTFMHTRRFISYHGDRFRDRSLVFENRRGGIVGVFPAAENPANPEMIISHPGLSYGGLVHDGSVRGASMIDALDAIANHYRSLGYRRLRYKAVPYIYHTVPTEDDVYALFRLGARRYQSDLSATVDVGCRGRVTQRRLRSRKRAVSEGVSIQEDWDEIEGFWRMLQQNLARRHGASPVHSLSEIQTLHERFPNDILLITAKMDADLVGGIVLFSSQRVLRVQYSATTEQGRAAFASDPVMEKGIEVASKRGCRYFDFGLCTVEGGRELNQGLYHFKVSFGGGGVVYDHYELEL
jgi:Acetyltransferase (GNAT) domain